MKLSIRLVCFSAALTAFSSPLVSAPAAPDALRERYVAGLAVIADAQATAARTGRMLDLIEDGADIQASRTAQMESRLLTARHQADSFDRQIQGLGAQTTRLLDQKQRIETRYGALERALGDDRTLLAKSTEAVSALATSAEKSGSYIERTIAENATNELKQHAIYLRDLVDRLAQSRQRISLERTLFEGLQPKVTAAATDLKALNMDITTTSDKVARLRTALGELRTILERDRASLSKQYQTFGVAIEGFRVTQADVIRRWLLDGPPAGELPSLSIDDIVESGLVGATFNGSSPVAFAEDPNTTLSARDRATGQATSASLAEEGEKNNQISAEFTQLNRRVRWLLSMLGRLELFAEQSLQEAEAWSGQTSSWRSQLTNVNRNIADTRGQLTSLQMEQDMVTTTIKLIGQQASDTTGIVAAAVKNLGAQADKLSSLTAELKRLSSN